MFLFSCLLLSARLSTDLIFSTTVLDIDVYLKIDSLHSFVEVRINAITYQFELNERENDAHFNQIQESKIENYSTSPHLYYFLTYHQFNVKYQQ